MSELPSKITHANHSFAHSSIHSLNVYLLLGANLGDRLATLRPAVELVRERIGDVIQQSGLYETAPWGFTDQPSFLTQVLYVETELEPAVLLSQTQAIEETLGR